MDPLNPYFIASLKPLKARIEDKQVRHQASIFFKKQNINKSTDYVQEFINQIVNSITYIISVITLVKFFKSTAYEIKKSHYNAAQKYYNFHAFLLKLGIFGCCLVAVGVYLPILFQDYFLTWDQVPASIQTSVYENNENLTISEITRCYNEAHKPKGNTTSDLWYDYIYDVFTGGEYLIESRFFIGAMNDFTLFNGNQYLEQSQKQFSGLYLSIFFLFSLIVVYQITIMAERKTKKALDAVSSNLNLSNLLFASNNLNLQEQADVELMSENIKQEFEKFHYYRQEKENKHENFKLTILIRIITWLFCILILFLSLLLVLCATVVTENYMYNLSDLDSNSGNDPDGLSSLDDSFWISLLNLIIEYLPSFAISLVNLISSFIFANIFQKYNDYWERHTQITMVNLTIIRKAGIRFSVLIFYYLRNNHSF